MRLLLDTHVLLWWQAGSRRLSRRAASQIRRADAVLVSAITCWEVATLVAQGRVELDRPIEAWVDALDADERITLVPLTPRAAVHALALHRAGFHGDPADRLIYATAAEHLVPLVTADRRMRGFAATGAAPIRILW